VSTDPALAGVAITVPANSLFSDSGARGGGRVGIAPVPPDRLPGPLPAGLELPVVITVQTDGPGNFDQPAPICFPNLPDPVLGTPLPPGSKQTLISFNHKKGIWEGVGSMTVSADGKLVCTDPGVGIEAPGWHGTQPGISIKGGKIYVGDYAIGLDPSVEQALLLTISDLFRALSGTGQYGADHLVKFLENKGQNIKYSPDSGPAKDITNHSSFKTQKSLIESRLKFSVAKALVESPNNPAVPDYTDQTTAFNFYEVPPTQLTVGIGGVGSQEVNVTNIKINSDGSYARTACQR
jgi:hypothetical protein